MDGTTYYNPSVLHQYNIVFIFIYVFIINESPCRTFNVLVRCVLHVIFILCSHSILAQGLSFECSIWFLPTLPHLYTPLPQGGICDLIASAIRLRLISSNQLSALHSLLGKSKHGKGGPELSYYLYLRLLLVPKLLFSLYTRNPPFPSDPRFDISGFLS